MSLQLNLTIDNSESTSNGCFPSTSRVTLENGKSVAMSELQIGDRVKTGNSMGFFLVLQFTK